MISVKIFSWASTCQGIPKQTPKTYSAGQKSPRYSQNRATDYDLGRNCLLGMNVSRHTETVPKNLLTALEVHGETASLDKMSLDIRTYICANRLCILHHDHSHRRILNYN